MNLHRLKKKNNELAWCIGKLSAVHYTEITE